MMCLVESRDMGVQALLESGHCYRSYRDCFHDFMNWKWDFDTRCVGCICLDNMVRNLSRIDSFERFYV